MSSAAFDMRRVLPQPQGVLPPDEVEVETKVGAMLTTVKVPPYGQRQKFIPRKPEDFGGGGAFPEIHVSQYPLEMGRKRSQQLVAQTNESGDLDFSAIHKQGAGDRKVWGDATDLMEIIPTEEDLLKPEEDEIKKTTEETRAALEKIVDGKINATQLANKGGDYQKGPTYMRYTPVNQNNANNSGSRQRVIRMVEEQRDPLEPPRFKAKKVPRGPPSPPAPVMHSPPRKLTAEEREEWKIPPCISNWKNRKGFTIALDKRLAADGRGLQQPQIGDKFAQLSKSLYFAERKVREEVSVRSQMRERLARQKRQEKEEQLRELADAARRERKGILSATSTEDLDEDTSDRVDREKLREERRREIARERRMEAMAPSKRKKTLEDRDISERVALGMAAPTTSESMFDQRLFNQSEGVSTGFGSEDSYSVFDKPLFHGGTSGQIYQHKKGAEGEYASEDMTKLMSTKRFKPDKGFAGAGGKEEATESSAQSRTGPVEYEKDDNDDPFGLDAFLSKTSKSGGGALDHIGKRGSLHAGASGGAGGDTMERLRGADSSRKMQFTKGSGKK